MELWHGSDKIIEHPQYGFGKTYNDYGQGFYCTESLDLACEWAVTRGMDGFANRYQMDLTGLTCIDLSSPQHSVLNWMALLVENRTVRFDSPVAKRGAAYLHEVFLPQTDGFDLIKGYRADDSYFSFARAFLNNTITVEQLARAMRLGKLGEQIVLKSRSAFERIEFIEAVDAPVGAYGEARVSRDREARADFSALLEEEDLFGIRMVDIVREGMDNDDARIR